MEPFNQAYEGHADEVPPAFSYQRSMKESTMGTGKEQLPSSTGVQEKDLQDIVEGMQRTEISEVVNGDGTGGDEDDALQEARRQAVLALSEIEKNTLRGTYPSRNTFSMDSGIKFTSQFEAGNLLKVVQVEPKNDFPCEHPVNLV